MRQCTLEYRERVCIASNVGVVLGQLPPTRLPLGFDPYIIVFEVTLTTFRLSLDPLLVIQRLWRYIKQLWAI